MNSRAQEWLNKNYPLEKRKEIKKIRIWSANDWELEGSLDLRDFVNLEEFSCERKLLTSLNVSGCSVLKSINCGWNQLTTLDVSGCPALDWLNCLANPLVNLNCRQNNNLKCLVINDTDIECYLLESFPASITDFYCSTRNKNKRPNSKIKAVEEELMKYGLPDGDSNFARLLHLRNNRLSLQNIINLEQQVKQLQQLQNDLKELGIDKNNLKGEVTKLRHDLTNKTKENQLQKNLFEAVKASVRGLSNNIWTQVENSNRVKAVLSELTKLTQQAQVAVPPK